MNFKKILPVTILLVSSQLKAQEIAKEMQKHFAISSERGNLNIRTFEKVGNRPETEVKDETYLFFYKKDKEKNLTLLQDESNPNSKILITSFKSGKVKKERFVKGKGYELITTDDDGKVWGVDMKDLDFTGFSDEEYSFKDLGQKVKCPSNQAEAVVLEAIPKSAERQGQSVKLMVTGAEKALCYASLYKKDQKEAVKRVMFSNFKKFEGRIRPMNIKVFDLTTPGKAIRAELNFQDVVQNESLEQAFK